GPERGRRFARRGPRGIPRAATQARPRRAARGPPGGRAWAAAARARGGVGAALLHGGRDHVAGPARGQ
ncbi:unnamed protein product, partial [Prorocentrum cordatum]